MKKLLIIAAMLLVLPMAVMADPIDRDAYLRNDDPGVIPPGGSGWSGPYAPGPLLPDTGWAVAEGGDIYIGILNEFVWANMKTITIVIEAATLDLSLDTVYADGAPASYNDSGSVGGASDTLIIEIFPQPDWEVIMLHNSGGAGMITSITIVSDCELIPSMTYYGLGILALLLIASTVWILRRKRVGSVA